MELKFEDLPRAMTEMMLEIRSIKEKVFENTKVEQSVNETMNTTELAEYLGCSQVSIYRHIKNGTLPYFKVGRRKYFKRDEVDEALKVK